MSQKQNKLPCITIVGGGWVGKMLALHLTNLAIKVMATATSDDSVQALIDAGISACKFKLTADLQIDVNSQVFQQQCLVVCIPPGIRYGNSDYADKIQQLVNAAEHKNSQVTSIILLSSTAVYNGLSGEVNEDSELALNANKVAILAQAEQVILSSKIQQKVVVRLAGLIGYNRHPGRFFGQQRSIPNPQSVVNFIHRDDVLGIITAVINKIPQWQTQQSHRKVFNAVAGSHPTRADFYRKALQALSYPQPTFLAQQEEQGKQVHSIHIANLDYTFKHNDLMQWLENSDDRES